MAARDKSESAIENLDFESAMAKLERCVRNLEGNGLGLEQALEEYVLAVQYVEYCKKKLDAATRRIAQLQRVTEDGKAITQAWDDTEVELEDKADARARRRGSGS